MVFLQPKVSWYSHSLREYVIPGAGIVLKFSFSNLPEMEPSLPQGPSWYCIYWAYGKGRGTTDCICGLSEMAAWLGRSLGWDAWFPKRMPLLPPPGWCKKDDATLCGQHKMPTRHTLSGKHKFSSSAAGCQEKPSARNSHHGGLSEGHMAHLLLSMVWIFIPGSSHSIRELRIWTKRRTSWGRRLTDLCLVILF